MVLTDNNTNIGYRQPYPLILKCCAEKSKKLYIHKAKGLQGLIYNSRNQSVINIGRANSNDIKLLISIGFPKIKA